MNLNLWNLLDWDEKYGLEELAQSRGCPITDEMVQAVLDARPEPEPPSYAEQRFDAMRQSNEDRKRDPT